MIGLTRLICDLKPGQEDRQGRKVFDVPKVEVENLRRRLEAAGWVVTIQEL